MVSFTGYDKPTAHRSTPQKGAEALTELRAPSRINFTNDIEETQRTLGTIKTENHIANQQQINASKALYEAMRGGVLGIGCNSSLVLDTLRSIPANQRNSLATTYADNYKRDLLKDLTKELSGKEELEALALLRGEDRKADAIGIYRSLTTNVKRFEKTLTALEGISPESRLEIEKEYTKLTQRTLTSDIEAAFKGSAKDLFLAIINGNELDVQTIKISRALENPTGNEGTVVKILQTTDIDKLSQRFQEREHKDLRQEVNLKITGQYKERANALFDGDTAKEGAIALKQATKRWTGGVEKVATVLGQHSAAEQKEISGRYEKEFKESAESRVTRNLPEAEAKAANALLQRGTLTLTEDIALELHRRRRNPEKIVSLLAGKSADEINSLREDYLHRYQKTIESDVSDRFSGRGEFIILAALKGPASTIQEGANRAEAHANFERGGLAGIAVHTFTEKGTYLDRGVNRAQAFAAQAAADGVVTPEERARGETLNGYAEANVKTFVKTKEKVSEQVGVLAATAVAAATAGAGAPVLVGALVGGPAHVAGRAIGDGLNAYDYKTNIKRDMANGSVEGLVTAAAAGVKPIAGGDSFSPRGLGRSAGKVVGIRTGKFINN
jgi:hypothetical protein